ncbi:MAG: AMP-binding protein [Verrucomicrobiae bacterium]|nr:AMP-binding protein [Verrucomicrobiae bacterium]
MSDPHCLSQRLRDSFDRNSQAPSILANGSSWSYADLSSLADAVRKPLLDLPQAPVAIFADRSFSAFASIVGTSISGRPFVPLNPAFPDERNAEIIRRGYARYALVEKSLLPKFYQLLRTLSDVDFDHSKPGEIRSLSLGIDLELCRIPTSAERDAGGSPHELSDSAYILFTSGSTGKPKGISVSRANLSAYLDHAVEAFPVGVGNRASQMFDLTFDLSIHDIFVTFLSGGALVVPTKVDRFSPSTFINRHQITHWFSVPSVLTILDKLRALKPGSFPSVKQSLFCGEALPSGLADKWRASAPNSSVFNLYGPTEATIAVSSFEITSSSMDNSPGVIPIGQPFPNHQFLLRTNQTEALSETIGELVITGPQVTAGYLDDVQRSSQSFVQTQISSFQSYRTGDLASEDTEGYFHFHGRIDSQIQLRGHRVEILEVECALKDAVESAHNIVVLPEFGEDGLASDLIAVFETSEGLSEDQFSLARLRELLGDTLPEYMLPSKTVVIDSFPLNSNGKIDRGKLSNMISDHYEDKARENSGFHS